MAAIFNNTILIPNHDGLVDSNQLPSTTIVSDIQKYNTGFEKTEQVNETQFRVFLTTNKVRTETIYCQRIEGLAVSREANPARSGGEGFYQVKLPGAVSYEQVVFRHLYTQSEVFLDWMINGAAQGGVLKGDIEIQIGPKDDYVSYILRDAFPVSWRLGNISILNPEYIKLVVQIGLKPDAIPLEEITVAYGRMDFSKGK